MAIGSEHYRESDLKRFTRIGFLIFIVLVAAGFLLSRVADEKVTAMNPHPHKTTLFEPSRTGSLPAR